MASFATYYATGLVNLDVSPLLWTAGDNNFAYLDGGTTSKLINVPASSITLMRVSLNLKAPNTVIPNDFPFLDIEFNTNSGATFPTAWTEYVPWALDMPGGQPTSIVINTTELYVIDSSAVPGPVDRIFVASYNNGGAGFWDATNFVATLTFLSWAVPV